MFVSCVRDIIFFSIRYGISMKKPLLFLFIFFYGGSSLIAEFVTQKDYFLLKEHHGYNVPPLIFLQNKNYEHDVSFNLSFLYYYAAQDGLDLANSGAIITNGTSTGTTLATNNSIALLQDFTYNPGFKAGMTVSSQAWTLHADYTYIRQTTLTSQAAIEPDPIVGTGVWILNNWFEQFSSVGQTMSTTDLASSWILGMDFADVTFGRAFYENDSAVITPFFGVRGAWIRQNLDITIDVPAYVVFDGITSPISSYNFSNSWAVGPRTGFQASWLFGHGLRIEGIAGASLLFTQFSQVTHNEDLASSITSQLSSQLPHVNCLRPQFDLGLGLGWGTYLHEQRYYIDFSMSYDFLVLWQQNMMRKLMDQSVVGTGAAAGDLYLQGLKINAAFYF